MTSVLRSPTWKQMLPMPTWMPSPVTGVLPRFLK